MKKNLKNLTLAISVLLLLLAQSCKEKTDEFADNEYLQSATREVTMTESNIVTLLNAAKTLYPGVESLIPDVASGVIVYSINYMTTFNGSEIMASGLVAVPSVPGTYPVLAYQNGTNTLHANAPSVNPYYTLYQLLECAASTGYVVVMADYLGFGVSEQMNHPYLHKESTVRTVVDMLRAVKEFDEDVAKDINISNDYYLLGYSQGGWATLALLENIEQEHGEEFNVVATACGAGPYDISFFNSYILSLTTYPMPVFLGYIANCYTSFSLFTNPLSDLFNQPYAGRIPGLYDGMHSSDDINDQLTTDLTALFNPDYVSGFADSPSYQGVRDALAENSISAWHSYVPILFLHGSDDTYVIPELSSRMHDAMISAGSNPVTCTYVTLNGVNHTTGIVPAGLAGLAFFKTLR